MSNDTLPSKKLLRCPFCGHGGALHIDDRDRWRQIVCGGCGAKAPEQMTEGAAYAAWNRRPGHEPPAEPVGFVARSKVDGTIFRDFAKPGECHPINDHCEWMPVYARPTQPPGACHFISSNSFHCAKGEIHEHIDDGTCGIKPSEQPAPALRPDGMPEPSLDVLKRVATRMRTDAPDSAYLVEWAAEQIEALQTIARAARDVCVYDWSDNDDDAVAAMDRLHGAVGPWLARSTSTKSGEQP